MYIKYKSLSQDFPEIAAEWHPTKNPGLTPDTITSKSGKKVWWICAHGHEWEMRVSDRTKGCGCPYCAGKRAWTGFNDIATTHAHLVDEWHPTKNGCLLPQHVTAGSNKKVHWKCKMCGHEWSARVADRVQGTNCPNCTKSGKSRPQMRLLYYIRKYVDPNACNRDRSFGVEFDILCTINGVKVPIEYDGWYFHKDKMQQDLQKNAIAFQHKLQLYRLRENPLISLNSTSIDLVFDATNIRSEEQVIEDLLFRLTRKTIHISFEDDNEVINTFAEQINREHSFLAQYPELAKMWHPTKNLDLKPEHVTGKSNLVVWWQCPEGHEWRTQVYHIAAGRGCPYCANKKVLAGYNDLETINPSLAKEWHPIKNGTLKPSDVTSGSNKKVWWKCAEGHEWMAPISNRAQGKNCPYCANQKVWPGYNDLITTHPQLAAEWHPTKNGILTAADVTSGCNQKVWWLGKCGHEWEATVNSRTGHGHGCPFCSNRKVLVGFNDLLTVAPNIAQQWHPTKNKHLTPQMVTSGSGKKVWWRCENGHEWQATVKDRVHGSQCPFCTNRKVLAGYNDLMTTHSELTQEWHPTKNGALKPSDFTAGSAQKVWWQCQHGHEWQATIHSRASGVGCTYCANQKVWTGFNDLATRNPSIANTWHPSKNGILTPQMVTLYSTQTVWWACKCGHEWKETVLRRTRVHKCPNCHHITQD